MGRVYVRLASELSETNLVAVSGRSEGATYEVAGQYGVPAYPNVGHEAMLASHPEIEAVVVAASEWMHTAPVLAALEAGKHVLVEKPMAVSAADAQSFVETAERVGVQLMVCHSLRFDHPYAAMRAAVAAGEIGEVMHLYSRRNTIQLAAERVLGKFSLAYWLTPHDIDMMLWTVGRPITSVKAYSREKAKGKQDFIIGVFTFDNGVVGVLETSWSTPAFSGRSQAEHFSIHGTEGRGRGAGPRELGCDLPCWRRAGLSGYWVYAGAARAAGGDVPLAVQPFCGGCAGEVGADCNRPGRAGGYPGGFGAGAGVGERPRGGGGAVIDRFLCNVGKSTGNEDERGMTVNWGIVGAGKIAESQFAPAVATADGHELAAVSRRDLGAAQRFGERHGARRAYDSDEALLADSEVDAVYVATPPHLHARQTVLAAEAGKHVLCEKPMAMNSAEAREMIDACRAGGVMLTICHYQRFNARHQRIRRLLDEGAIGLVTAARLNFSDRFPPQPGVWHHRPEISGGGPVMDLGIHCIDLLRFLCGPAESVAALVETLVDSSPVADTSTLLLRLASGAQAVVTSHWTTANHEPERTNGLEIRGTEGSIAAAPISAKDSSGSLRVLTAEGTRGLFGRAGRCETARCAGGGVWQGGCRRGTESDSRRGGAGRAGGRGSGS